MRAVAVVVAIFALLAIDLVQNGGEWTESAGSFVIHTRHQFETALYR